MMWQILGCNSSWKSIHLLRHTKMWYYEIMRLYAVRCNHDVLLMPINGFSNATTYTVLCHFSVKKHPPDYSYSACLILRLRLCSNFLGLICLHQDGMTALIFASGGGYHHVMDSLIQAGASINHESAVRTWHNLYRERYDREGSRYKQEDWRPVGWQGHS